MLIIGISGVTCGGKTTLARKLANFLPNSAILSQDLYFHDLDDPRHTRISDLDHINFDILSSLDMPKMLNDITKLIANAKHSFLIVEGFSIFNYPPIEKLCNLKYFFTLPYEVCRERRQARNYDPPDCPGYFEKCAWPEHLKQLKEVQDTVQDVKYLDGKLDDSMRIVLKDIRLQ